uniref:HTH_48 domain-containing protein n=1 Tax=Caenorhabditis tropicalis TaxID=1561998 RepID=A0A1I7TUF6_9PELO
MRVCLWYGFKQHKTASESFRTLSKVFGDEVLTQTQVYEWFEPFKNGDDSLEDHGRQNSPQTIDNDILKQVIESDPSQTTRELAQQFRCFHGIIKNHSHAIGKKNRCEKWTPHELSDINKTTRVATARVLLRRTKNSGFLDSIVTGDEK